MINAKQARELAKNIDVFTDSKQKILEVNKQKKNFICLPFKIPIIKDSIIGASRGGYDCVKIYNEITPEVEATLIKQGFKVKWLKRYVKISW